MLGRGWGKPQLRLWSRIDPRNNRKYAPDQQKDASCSDRQQSLSRSENESRCVRVGKQSYAQGLALERGHTVRLELPQELSRVHHTFNVSILKKCYADEPLVMSRLEEFLLTEKL
ncbi:hypothetical protein Tco_0661980 [Tanacetum coccineum]